MKKDGKINKKYIGAGLVLLAVFAYFVFSGSDKNAGVYTVARADISQSAVLSGTVKTRDKADLGFADSGRVAKVFVTNNQKVSQGQTLAQLEIGDLWADLKIKQANLRTSDVDLVAAKNELDRITEQEDVKVESAYRTLLSSDLTLTSEDDSSTVPVPMISGIYTGGEGIYKVIIRSDDVNRSDYDLYTFNLEKTKRELNITAPTPLGTKGLYISFFNSDLTDYDETVWYMNIPNKSGPTYLSNFNSYNEAKKARDLAVQNAKFKYEKLLTEGNNGNSSIAQAEIQKINAEIRKNTIYAPFNGRVTNIEKEVGESASIGERVISILGEGTLEVVLQVSELDVSRIVEDSSIEVTLDAFATEFFNGTLTTINSRDTEVEGVPVYEAFVELPADTRIKTGMSAKGKIVFDSREDVIAIPSYLISTADDISTVEVMMVDGKTEKREVVLGLRGSDSMVEIISGLNEGDKIASNTNEK